MLLKHRIERKQRRIAMLEKARILNRNSEMKIRNKPRDLEEKKEREKPLERLGAGNFNNKIDQGTKRYFNMKDLLSRILQFKK
jgi:hypothetical protein